ncbi:MAG: hypothetical protein Q8Q58_09580 [Candidatus Rokubacteria bacterium]|nr:hypothetical protein [Candidatus Rokubacteria bacterium]
MRRVTAWVERHPDASAALALFLLPFAVHAPVFLSTARRAPLIASRYGSTAPTPAGSAGWDRSWSP